MSAAAITSPRHERFTRVAMALHWAVAALILFNLAVGFFMEGWPQPLRGQVVGLHISSGITVLGLSIVRVIWRLTHRPPPFAPGMAPWEVMAAHTVHFLLYAMMFVLPLTGWSIVSAHPPRPGAGFMIWGLAKLPPLAPVQHIDPAMIKAAHDKFVDAHGLLAWVILALLALHVGGALKHQFIDRHAEFARMGIGRG
jgi:cytochrome b561